MPLCEDIITSRYSIQAYDSDQITINERQYFKSLILTANQLIDDWPVTSVNAMTVDNLTPVFSLKPDVVLLGTGEHQIFPGFEILSAFAEKGLGIEVMNTGALCRTFNILVAEDRNVAAAIIK